MPTTTSTIKFMDDDNACVMMGVGDASSCAPCINLDVVVMVGVCGRVHVDGRIETFTWKKLRQSVVVEVTCSRRTSARCLHLSIYVRAKCYRLATRFSDWRLMISVMVDWIMIIFSEINSEFPQHQCEPRTLFCYEAENDIDNNKMLLLLSMMTLFNWMEPTTIALWDDFGERQLSTTPCHPPNLLTKYK